MDQKINILYSSENKEITPLLESIYRVLTACAFDDYHDDNKKDVHAYVTNMNTNIDIRYIHISDFDSKDIRSNEFYILVLEENAILNQDNIQPFFDSEYENSVILKSRNSDIPRHKTQLESLFSPNPSEYEILNSICHIMRVLYLYLKKSNSKEDIRIFMSYRWKDEKWKKLVKEIGDTCKLCIYIDEYEAQRKISEIPEALENSIGMLILYHDTYGSSYYTVDEVILARNKMMPMVVIQTGTNEITRILQQIGNLRMFLDLGSKEEEKKINILKAIIHIFYMNILKITMEKNTQMKEHIKFLPFQPTLYDLTNKDLFKGDGDKTTTEYVIYPEPVIFKKEREQFEDILSYVAKDKYKLSTVMQYQMQSKKSEEPNLIVQFSASNVLENNSGTIGGRIKSELIDFVKLLVKYLLDNNNRIAYMGSLSKSYVPNYTRMIFNAASEYENQFLNMNDEKQKEKLIYIASHQRKENKDGLFNHDVAYHIIQTQNDEDGREKFANTCGILLAVGGKEKEDELSGIITEILGYYKQQKPIFLIPDFSGLSKSFGLFIRAVIQDKMELTAAIHQHLSPYVPKQIDQSQDYYMQFIKISKLKSIGEFYNNQLSEQELLELENCNGNYYEKIKIIIKGVNKCQMKK